MNVYFSLLLRNQKLWQHWLSLPSRLHLRCQLPALFRAGALLLTPAPIPVPTGATYSSPEGLDAQCGKQEAQDWGALHLMN